MNLKTKTMIQSSELRMSNYVYSSDFVIKSYSPQGLFNLMKNIDDGYNNINPIPLTEQWLIDFGFENISCGEWQKGYIILDNEYTDKGIWNIVEDYQCLTIAVKHVHQLQNLYFALTNKELSYESKS
jgi:hypothetical protein